MLPSFIAGGLFCQLLFAFIALTGRVCLLQNYSVALCILSSLKKLLFMSDFFVISRIYSRELK
jgi:hypothetical protein